MYKNFVIALTMFFFGFWCRNAARCIRRQLSLCAAHGFRLHGTAALVAGGAAGLSCSPPDRLRGRCGFSGTAYYEDMMYTGDGPVPAAHTRQCPAVLTSTHAQGTT